MCLFFSWRLRELWEGSVVSTFSASAASEPVELGYSLMDMEKVCRGEGKNWVKSESKHLCMTTRAMSAKSHQGWRLLIGARSIDHVGMERVRCKMPETQPIFGWH